MPGLESFEAGAALCPVAVRISVVESPVLSFVH